LDASEQEARFRQWLAEHTGLLLKVVRSFAAGPADADDLLQEILLQVWMSLPNFREQSKPTTWLYRVALNTALAWKRRENKHRKNRQTLDVVSNVMDASLAYADPHADREALEQLYAAVRSLAAAKRALVLLYLDGLSYAEMAEVTGLSESNVGVRLTRIKKELAAALKVPAHVA
jgi:RNA polymerase sigma-70 factor (ECF subfamily)